MKKAQDLKRYYDITTLVKIPQSTYSYNNKCDKAPRNNLFDDCYNRLFTGQVLYPSHSL